MSIIDTIVDVFKGEDPISRKDLVESTRLDIAEEDLLKYASAFRQYWNSHNNLGFRNPTDKDINPAVRADYSGPLATLDQNEYWEYMRGKYPEILELYGKVVASLNEGYGGKGNLDAGSVHSEILNHGKNIDEAWIDQVEALYYPDIDLVKDPFSGESYWSPNIASERVEKNISNFPDNWAGGVTWSKTDPHPGYKKALDKSFESHANFILDYINEILIPSYAEGSGRWEYPMATENLEAIEAQIFEKHGIRANPTLDSSLRTPHPYWNSPEGIMLGGPGKAW